MPGLLYRGLIDLIRCRFAPQSSRIIAVPIRMFNGLQKCMYAVSQKGRRHTIVHIFAKYWSILKILSLAHSPAEICKKKRCLESHHTVSVSHCRYTTLRNKNIQNPYRMQSRQRQSSLRAHTLKWRGCSRGRWAAGVLSREDQQGRKTSQHKNGICRRVKIRLHWLEIRQSRSHNEYVNASCFCHNSVDTRLRCAGILIIALLQIS